MKTQNRILTLVFLMLIISIGFASCSKDETPPPPEQIVDTDKDGIADTVDNCPNEVGPASNNGCPVKEVGEIVETEGIETEDLETYQGAIGIVVDARPVAKKGYTPKTVAITVNATSGDYSETIELDPYSFMGQINLEIADLSDDAFGELENGVQVAVEVFDASGTSILSESLSKLSFESNPLPVSVKANDLEDKNTSVILNPTTPYYMQRVEEDGTPVASAALKRINDNDYNDVISITSQVEFSGDEDNLLFYFEKDENKDRYQIRHKGTNSYLRRVTENLKESPFGSSIIKAEQTVIKTGYPSSGFLSQRFIFKKVKNGVYRVQDYLENNFQVTAGAGLTIDDSDGEDLYVRLIPMNIDWLIQPIASESLTPILPPAQSGFSFNNTLINCGQGELSQEIGTSKAIKTTTSVGWEETLSISSAHTAGGTIAVGMEVSGSFFGNGATYSAEASASYDYTTTNTTETSNWNEAVHEFTDTFFSKRLVTVPSKSASLVYDAFQTYDNVKVNVVQRLRVKASEHDTGDTLSGEEISTQFHFNGFDGVITEIGSDYIEVTVRGVATMDKIFKQKSEVREVAPNCSN